MLINISLKTEVAYLRIAAPKAIKLNGSFKRNIKSYPSKSRISRAHKPLKQ